jgi:hypothetical protein
MAIKKPPGDNSLEALWKRLDVKLVHKQPAGSKLLNKKTLYFLIEFKKILQ